jgi:hypothetical protein
VSGSRWKRHRTPSNATGLVTAARVIPTGHTSIPFLKVGWTRGRRRSFSTCESGTVELMSCLAYCISFFAHFNNSSAILDPVLHNASSCRSRSSLLFTCVLTVAAKVAQPSLYSGFRRLANCLFGDAIALGASKVDIIQSILLFAQWRSPDDCTAYHRVGLAIRMAQELRLNVRGARPLPATEMEAREVLNGERTWLCECQGPQSTPSHST